MAGTIMVPLMFHEEKARPCYIMASHEKRFPMHSHFVVSFLNSTYRINKENWTNFGSLYGGSVATEIFEFYH